MRFLFFIFIISFTGQAFSTDYVWRLASGARSNIDYPSALAGCTAEGLARGFTVNPSMDKLSETYFECRAAHITGSPVSSFNSISRSGTSCPLDTVYDSTTGACIGNPCSDKNGQSQRFQKSSASSDSYGSVHTINGKTYFSPQTAGCFSGCAVSTADQKCVSRVSGAYVCRGTAYYTGQSCATGSAAPAPVEATTSADPAPANLKTDLPCKYVSNPDGTQSCTSITAKESEGLQCGTVNGQQTCLAKDPVKDETKIDTTVSTVTNPDGSTTTIKTDTQTKTTCPSYAPSCKSTTTTTTSTTTMNADGDLIASDGTCTGTNCSSSGNPDSDGDGFGDCTGDNCGEGEDGKPSNKPTMPKLDGAPSYADSLNSFQQKIKVAPIYAAVGGLSVPSGGACSFGSAQTFFGPISFDDFCAIAPQILNPLRYLFLAIWAWAAIRLFFTA